MMSPSIAQYDAKMATLSAHFADGKYVQLMAEGNLICEATGEEETAEITSSA